MDRRHWLTSVNCTFQLKTAAYFSLKSIFFVDVSVASMYLINMVLQISELKLPKQDEKWVSNY